MRCLLSGLVIYLAASPGWADTEATPHIMLGANEYLVAGAQAIIAGSYDEGIRLTLIGLERAPPPRDRAAGLANLCAAYVAKEEPDKAIPYCTESLGINPENWRVYTNRARAYLLKGMFAEAVRDNDAAFAINPNSAHVRMMRGMLNERTLKPEVILEEHN